MLNNLSIEQKKELEMLGTKYRKMAFEKYKTKFKNTNVDFSYSLTPNQMLGYVKEQYKKEFLKTPNNEELAMMSLYSLLPNDPEFMNLLRKYKYKTNKVAEIFSLPDTIIRNRYKYILEKRKDEINSVSVDDLLEYIKTK